MNAHCGRCRNAPPNSACKWSRSFNPPEKPIHTQSLGRSFLRGRFVQQKTTTFRDQGSLERASLTKRVRRLPPEHQFSVPEA